MKHPLSQTQLGIYITAQNSTEEGNYNIDSLFHLDDDIDLDRLAAALEQVIEAHPYVKSRIVLDDNGEPAFEDHSADAFHTPIIEVESLDQVRNHFGADYDLLHDQLFRLEIYKTAKEGNWLYVDFFHIVYDGMSCEIFRDDLAKAYNGETLDKEAIDGFTIAENEVEIRKSDFYQEAKDWYLKEFGAANEVESMPLPDKYGDEEEHFTKLWKKLDVDQQLLADFCQKEGVKESTLYTAAFGYTLSKFTASDEVLYTTVFHGRSDKATRHSFCMMVKTLPVYHNFPQTPSVKDLLLQTQTQNLGTRKYAVYSFADAHTDLGISADVGFVYQGALHDTGIILDGKRQQETSLMTHTPGYKFLCMLLIEDGTPYIWCEYQTNKFTPEFIEGFWESYVQVVKEMCCKEMLADIEICTPKQLAQLDAFNAHYKAAPFSAETVLSAFRKAAAQYPDNTAVIFKDKKLSYRELDQLSERIGAYIYQRIKDCGKREPVVSILIERSELMAILPLAVMKAGAAYQPLDPSYPQERLNFMVKDSEAVMLIADPQLRNIVNDYQGEVLFTSDLENIEPSSNPLPELLCPASLFILLYTSGTTGVPKGVMLEHENLIAFCHWYQRYYDLRPEHRVAAYASFGFDACMMDLYPALTTGAAVVIVPEEKRLDLIALGEYFQQNGVTHSFITTQVGVQFLQNVEGCTTLKHLSVGGEKLVSVDPAQGYTFHNGYGPTECTIFSTTLPVLKNEPNIPIGKPTDSLRCYVVDKYLHRLPVGAAGELIIVGAQVGRGYLNRPDKTAEAFFTMGGENAYHSGDIVRYREDGNIEFVGRKDGQVKIRGFRIELKEVEAVIREFSSIKDCTVQAFDDPNGGKFIAAYVVTDDESFDIEELNAFILDRKPPYMVPAHTMILDKIPLNVNQKVDRKALPKPEVKAETGKVKGESAPLNALELQLKDIISTIVNVDDISITEPLAYFGLTSISSIKLAVQIFKKYGVQLDSKTLAKTGTLQNIENAILEHLLHQDEASEVAEKEEITMQSAATQLMEAPLSFTQQGVYTECMTNPDNINYNMPMCLTFAAGVTTERIKNAVTKVFEAHQYMACHFVEGTQGEIVQQPIADFKLEIPICQKTTEEFDQYKKAFVRPFNLAQGPLFRFEVVETEGICHLLLDIHHLIGDGASVDLFTHQVCDSLNDNEIEIEKYDYYHFVQDQKMDETAEAYFDQTIGGIEEVSRLANDIFTEEQNHTPRSVSARLSAQGMDAFARAHNLTPAAFFLAATTLTVSRFVCEDEVSVATISNGRSNLLVNNTMGMFVNTLPIAMHVGINDKTNDFLANAAAALDNAIQHESYPFARVASKYGFMPNISYACQLGVIEPLCTAEGPVEMDVLELTAAKIPVSVFVNGSLDSEIELQVEYDSALYTEAMMQHFVDSIRNVATALMTAQTLSEISLTTEEDWKQLDAFNPEFFTDYDMNDSAVSLFRKKVAAHPDKTAAVYKDKRYTYRELDAMTDHLASIIYRKISAITGKKELSEEVVSIIIDRNEWVFLLPLAVLKTGCAYEPLDPSYPATRLNFMVQDAKACLLLGQPELVTLVDEYKGEVLLTSDLEPQLTAPTECEKLNINAIAPTDLMLMLYTSGSTGQPKGVQIEHRNIITFVKGVEKAGFYGEDSRVAAYASFGFDVCMMDIFCTLLNGGTLYVVPEDMRLELSRLKEYMDEEEITQIFMTTQVGVQFLLNYPQMKSLRTLSMGGEKLPAVHPEGLSYRILNGYGPTENTCGVSQFVIKEWEPNIPLGKPMPTVLGYVLDKAGHRLPPGACGEYCVAGYQPARGYLGLPEKTAQVFEAFPPNMNPTDRQDLRLYHTGDVVRYRENGDVEFVGRKDGMVKIRGFRIELKEVEAAIRPFENVADVTVQAYDYESGGKYLAAFVVAKEGTLDTEALLAFVKSQKPPYMVPAIVVQLDKIPLTVNQKVDKKALPKPQLAAAEYVAPKGRVEEDFCEIFAEVLGQEKISAASDFFEIGGSSIIALKVVIAAEKRGYSIVYNDVFTYTTPQTMAEHLGNGNVENTNETASAVNIDNTENASFYGPNTTEIGPDGFDYRAINALLRGNTKEALLTGERQPLGNVLLAGATGFLGIHILKDLIDNYDNRIHCFIRGKGSESAEERLKQMLKHYFDQDFAELFGKRIFIVEGDATDPKALDGFEPDAGPFTVINCAACVKHFSKGNEIELVNVTSVRNLVFWCVRHNVRLVHVSTGSVMGVYVNPALPEGFNYDEHLLYVGQTIDDNQYVHSKFMAERLIYDAILHQGLHAKVMRVGNLSPRNYDGTFQINYETNNFMATLAAYQFLGMIPYEVMDTLMEFSPIDRVARAILLLSTTPDKCVCFMPSNHYRPHMGDIVMQFEALGTSIRMVEAEEFQKAIADAMADPTKVDKMRPFMVYADNGPAKRPLGPDVLNVNYTVQALYRLGFQWPQTGADYVQRFMRKLQELGFFE